MPKLVAFEGDGPGQVLAGELAVRIRELVGEYAGRMPLATAVGAIEIAKLELLQSHQ